MAKPTASKPENAEQQSERSVPLAALIEEKESSAQSPAIPPSTDGSPVLSELDDAIPGLWIRSVTPSFRRCGFTFTREGHGIALSALTEDEVEELMNEPNLVVEHTCFTDPVQE